MENVTLFPADDRVGDVALEMDTSPPDNEYGCAAGEMRSGVEGGLSSLARMFNVDVAARGADCERHGGGDDCGDFGASKLSVSRAPELNKSSASTVSTEYVEHRLDVVSMYTFPNRLNLPCFPLFARLHTAVRFHKSRITWVVGGEIGVRFKNSKSNLLRQT
jgi:hypothetical protein